MNAYQRLQHAPTAEIPDQRLKFFRKMMQEVDLQNPCSCVAQAVEQKPSFSVVKRCQEDKGHLK